MIRKLTFGTLVIGLVVVGMAAQATAHLLALPSPTGTAAEITGTAPTHSGPHAVGVRTIGTDEAPVAMTLWYPAVAPDEPTTLTYSYGVTMFGTDSSVAMATFTGAATPGADIDTDTAPYPLVVLSPGFAITASSYAWLAERIASHGFVVAAPHHRESLDPRGLWRAAIERPDDVLAVLDHVDTLGTADEGFAGSIDTDAIAVVGHSFGGLTALASAGARIDTDGFRAICDDAYATDDPLTFQCDALIDRAADMADLAGMDAVPSGLWPAVADPRIDAVVSIAGDAAIFGPEGLAEVTVPVMAIGGTADHDAPFAWGTQLAYEHTSGTRKVEIALDGAGHLVFAGGCEKQRRILSLVSLGFCSDPGWDRAELHDLVGGYVTTFLLAELADDRDAAAALDAAALATQGVGYRSEGF